VYTLYDDVAIAEGYLDHMTLSYAASQSSTPPHVETAANQTFFGTLVSKVYESLQQQLSEPLPRLHIHASHGEADAVIRLNAKSM
jgi:hypothetical protein